MPIGCMLITSASNEKVKHARRVRDGREAGLIFVEGQRLAEECVRSNLTIQACFHTPETVERTHALLQQLAGQQVPCHPTHAPILASLSGTVSTQGIILIAQRPVFSLEQALRAPAPLLLVGLDRVQDPGNVGTLIRTAEAAGASGVLLSPGSADPFSPKVLRSAMGSAFRLPIIEDADLRDIGTVTGHLRTAAAAGSGDTSHYDYDWRQPTLLWLGNEARGLSDALIDAADFRLRIPLHPPVESLNVAAAGAALLFEAVRQRQHSQKSHS